LIFLFLYLNHIVSKDSQQLLLTLYTLLHGRLPSHRRVATYHVFLLLLFLRLTDSLNPQLPVHVYIRTVRSQLQMNLVDDRLAFFFLVNVAIDECATLGDDVKNILGVVVDSEVEVYDVLVLELGDPK